MDLKNPPSLSKIFGDFFTGFGAGLIGTAVFGIVLLLSWSIVGDTLAPTDVVINEFGVEINQRETHPLFLHFITLAIFMGILSGNVAFVVLKALIDPRYENKATMMSHVFFANLVILVLMLPAYIIFSNLFASDGVAFAAVLHIVVSVLFSFFVLEFVNFTKHLLVSLYGAIFGLLLFLWVAALMLKSNPSMLAFLSLPLLMGFILSGNRIAQATYAWMYQSYGVDMLNIDTRFGADYIEKKK